jgi:cobalt/nickel transport system permease protein
MSFGHYIEVGRMDELGRMDSPVHRLDARVKALATLAFIVAVMSFPRYELSALMPFFLYPFALMAAGNIPFGYILRKLLIASPFALAVGIFNPFLDRQVVVSLGGYGISGGWLSFASIAVRFALTVGAALALVACTGIHRLCAGLERMGLPKVFAVQLQLLYRYLFVITGEGLRMMRGVELRSMGRPLRFRTYASLVGHLLLRSMDRAQRVYQAMVARGFDGRIRVMRPAGVGGRDIAFLVGWVAFFVVARLWNLADGLGRIFTGAGL